MSPRKHLVKTVNDSSARIQARRAARVARIAQFVRGGRYRVSAREIIERTLENAVMLDGSHCNRAVFC